jgi:hypothetical protein
MAVRCARMRRLNTSTTAVRTPFVRAHQSKVLSVQRLCRLLKLSHSAYYAWCNRQPGQRQLANQTLDRLISRFYLEANGFAGYRMIRGLLIESGTQASLNRVRRRMRQIGNMGRQFKRKRNTTNSHHRLGCTPNLVQQEFTVQLAREKPEALVVPEAINVCWSMDFMVRQNSLGVSGHYKTPLIEMKFFDDAYDYALPESRVQWEKVRTQLQLQMRWIH